MQQIRAQLEAIHAQHPDWTAREMKELPEVRALVHEAVTLMFEGSRRRATLEAQR